MLALSRIQFDRGTHTSPAALPLRANSNQPPAEFDWSRDSGVAAQPVAFPRSAAGRAALMVELRLATMPPVDVLVRARALPAAALGDVTPFTVTAGTSGTVTCSAGITDALTSHPVDKTELHWSWESSDDCGSSWSPFDETRHDVYVVLDEPQFPWGRPGNAARVAPWVDVVDQACKWAGSTSDEAGALRGITEGVHRLGGQPIMDERGCPQTIAWQSGTDYHVSNGRSIFLCSAFIGLARLQSTDDFLLNCRDCASAVGTFGAVLGVPLQRTNIFPPDGANQLTTNSVWLLGGPAARSEEFAEHVAASRGSAKALFIWDACLKLDFDPGPPRDWEVATAVPFDVAPEKGQSYRKLLLKPGQAKPQVFEGESLSYPDDPPAAAAPFHSPALEHLRALFTRMLGGWRPIVPQIVIDDLDLLQYLRVDEKLVESRPIWVDGVPYLRRHAPLPAFGIGASTLRLDMTLTRTADHTRAALLDILIGYTTPLIPVADVGDVAFYCQADESIVAVRGSLVIWLRNDPRRAVPIRSQMRRVDAILAPALI